MKYPAKANAILGWILNVFTVLCACYIVWHFASRLFLIKTEVSSIQVGSSFPLKNIKFSERTLVMALSTECPYCRASSGFYRTLIPRASASKVHITAIFTQPPEQARAYLLSEGLGLVTDIRQVDLHVLHVGTPTLFLVDRAGIVRSVWTGFLPEQGEEAVLRAMAKNATASQRDYPSPKAATALLHKELRLYPGLTVIDVRDRLDFAKRHLAVAENIPADELEIRAPHEIEKSKPIRIYCGSVTPGCDARRGISGICAIGEETLQDEGFKNVGIIYANMTELASAGFAVVDQGKQIGPLEAQK